MILIILLVQTFTTSSDATSVTLLSVPNDEKWVWDSSGWTTGTQGSFDIQYICPNEIVSPPSNWLWSPVINVAEAKALFINITFTMKKCAVSQLLCRENLTLHAYQGGEGGGGCPRGGEEGYRYFATITAKHPWTNKDNRTRNTGTWMLTIEPNTSFTCIAVHDQGACVTLFSFVVSYNFCPLFTDRTSLVRFPRTVAPGHNYVNIRGSCPENMLYHNSSSIYGYCDSSGEWNTSLHYGTCQCKQGFELYNNDCKACWAGTYKSQQGNSKCVPCPENSISEKQATYCNCTENKYRAPGEGIAHNCTGPPSPVEKLTPVFLNETAATINWTAPEETGGRTDLLYDVNCSATCQTKICDTRCDSVFFSNGRANLTTTHVRLESLNRTVTYTIRLLAKNGVSKLAGSLGGWSGKLVIRAVPRRPHVTIAEQTESTVAVSWFPQNHQEDIKRWLVSCKEAGARYQRNTTRLDGRYKAHTFTDLLPNTRYTFQVQGKNSRGLGLVAEIPVLTRPSTHGRGGERASEEKKQRTLVVAVSVAVSSFVLIICLALLLISQRRTSASALLENMALNGSEMTTRGKYIDPSNYDNPLDLLKDFTSEISRNSVKLEDVIGRGEFADVHRGTLKTSEGNIVVAIKILKQGSTLKNKDDFLFEASIMGQFHHPNVIRLEGIITKTRPMMIITELMEKGSLLDFLTAHKKLLTPLQLIGMARGVAAGMKYLSEMNFIHRDLAARNVLVGENMICKVADFGLSRELSNDSDSAEYMTQGGKIAVRWTAPEALNHRTFYPASDVWSYGVVLWEIMGFGERPYWDWNNMQVMQRVLGGYRLPSPPDCPQVIHDIMIDCWDPDKNKRPTFGDIMSSLDVFIRSPEQMTRSKRRSLKQVFRKDIVDFSQVTTVQEWLESIKMASYLPNFHNAGYAELHDVARLEQDDLCRIGIRLIGHRNKIFKSIKRMHLHFTNLAFEAC